MGDHPRKADGRRVFSAEFKRTTVQRIVTGEKTVAVTLVPGPSKPPAYSSFDLPSFSGETSPDKALPPDSTTRTNAVIRRPHWLSEGSTTPRDLDLP